MTDETTPVVDETVDAPVADAAEDITADDVIDEDDEVTNDTNLSTNVEFKNYGRLGMPIRTPLA